MNEQQEQKIIKQKFKIGELAWYVCSERCGDIKDGYFYGCGPVSLVTSCDYSGCRPSIEKGSLEGALWYSFWRRSLPPHYVHEGEVFSSNAEAATYLAELIDTHKNELLRKANKTCGSLMQHVEKLLNLTQPESFKTHEDRND